MAITRDPYFDWLCILIGLNKINPRRNYGELVKALHSMEFKPKLQMDANRGTDGMQLRVDFINEHGPWGSATNRGPCTMLEFLIALAKRMNFLTYEQHPYTEYYFWKMIDNMGLAKATDDRWNYINGDFFVEDAVYRINNRMYNPDGTGGIFPLKHADRDQRATEIWYQMNAWLMENYNAGWF